MKTFSFQSIFKNFSKITSLLASQMPWCNLRVNLGTISVLSRVSGPFSHRASHFAAILTILFTIGVGSVWGDDYTETYYNPTGTNTPARANGMGAFSAITCGTGTSFGNSALQISTNGGSGSFTVASIDGSDITSIAFTSQSSYPINTLTTSADGTITRDGSVYTFTAKSPMTSATFDMSAESGKKVRVASITVNLTSDYEYFSKNFSISSGTVSCTKSNGSSDITITSTGGTSNNGLTLANTKALTIASSGHNIKAIHFTCESHNTMSNLSANTGTYSSNSWTKGESTNSVTFTSSGSNATIVGISVELEPSCGETAQAALTLSSNSGTICGTGTTTFTVNGGSGTGELSVTSSDPTKATATINGTTVTVTGVAAGNATITVTKACDATYAEATATYSATVAAIPTANAGADKTTEPGNGVALAATAAASGCTGAWTIQSGPNTSTAQLSSTSSATATFTPTVAGTYTLRWTVTNTSSSCSAYDEMTVNAAQDPDPGTGDCTNCQVTIGISNSSSYTSSFTSSSTNSNITAEATAFTAGSKISSSNSSYSNATAPYSVKYKPNSNINTTNYSDDYSVSAQFTVKSGYVFEPTAISATIVAEATSYTYQAILTDGTTTYASNEITTSASNQKVTFEFPSFTGNGLSGNVTFKIWFKSEANNQKFFVVNLPITITGKVCSDSPSTPVTTTITLSSQGGTGGTESVTATYNSSTLASITNPARDCYTFDGWYSGENGTGSLVINTIGVLQANVSGYTGDNGVWIATENKTLYAKWTKNATTLLLQRIGTEATPAGGVFVGDNAGTLTCIAEQGTIVSYQWKQNTKGSKDGAVNAVGEGATTANFSPKPTEAGSYWYYCVATDECGNEVETSLSGRFLFNTLALHTITFDPNGGNVEPTSATQAEAGAAITLPTPTWDGHTFAGWYTAASGGTKIGDAGASYAPTADITIYAQWETPCVAPTNAVINGGGTYNSGSNITLTVTANNITNGMTTYTWYRSNSGQEAAITAGSIQEASTNNTYVINSCVQSDAQVYYCLISNGDGCNAVASTSIAINVVTTYTLTYDANAGTDEVANMPAPEQHTPGTYTLSDLVPTRTGYTFAGWNRNPEGTGDNFNAADQFTTGALNETLYAKWTPETYNIYYYEAVGEVNDISGLNPISIDGAPTSYTILDAVTLPAFPAKDGYTATGWYNQWCVFENIENTQSWAGCEPTTGHPAGYYGHANYIVKYTPEPTTLTALECNTRYTVQDMTAGGCGTLSTTSCYSAGLSANNRFEVLGDPSQTDQAGGTPEQKTNSAQTINSISFDSFMYLKGDGLNGSTEPTCRGVKFIIPSAGKLIIYYRYGDRSKLKKEGETAVNVGTTTDGYGYDTHDVTAGTYYIYGASSGAVLIAVEYQCCTTPAAPTAFSAGSITSTGATFTITDAGDAASYDIYYSTSSTAPTASTPATTTSTSKTKAITGLTASTTYYAWVRSVCDADHKSAWVALTSPTAKFTTSAAAALNDGCWDPKNTDADKLTSGDVSLTTFENNFSDVEGITSVTIQSKGTSDGQCSGADEGTPSGYMKVKNASSSGVKIITIVTSTAKDITIGGEPYGSNTGSFYLVKSTAETKLAECNTGATDKATNCPAGTYYVYAKGNSSKSINFSLLCIEDAAPDETAPTFVSSVPANGATGVATSGTIVLTFSEALGSVDASKFTLTGATKGAVAIDGSDATKVNIAYSGAANEATVTLATAAAAVSDVAGNALAAALSNISFTTAAAAPAGDCEELFAGSATSTSVFTPSAGSATFNLSSGNSFSAGGYSYSVKPNSSNAIVASPKAGSFAAGDSLIVVVYNNESGSKTMGFQLGSGKYSASVGSKKLHIFRQVLVASDISEGKVTFNRQSSDDRWVEIIIKHCGLLPSCTTPELSDLEDQIVCPGEDVSWTAIVNNTEDLADGETIAYQWTKKGNATILSETATLTLTGITEAAGGTYVVTATVSADGKASKTASKEVTLTVRPATATPTITANANTIYTDNDVTLTATCASSGVGYQWYTCNDAEGNGESEIDGATNATYTLTAGEAGTYYYKVIVTGDDNHSCGTAEKVYTLVVSAAIDASDCTTYFWFPYAQDATSNDVTNNENNFFGNSPKTGSSNSSTYNFELDDKTYTATKNTGSAQFTISFTVPENSIGTMAINCKGSSSKPLYLKHTDDTQILVSDNSSDKNFVIENITPGTWTLQSSGNWALSGMAVKVCSGSTCTDPEVIATVDNATVCEDTENVTFTATNYADGATFQWQKKDGNTWTNINGATSATYTISSVTTEHAGQYRVIATNECSRTSEELTLTVLTAPEFNAFANTASVMKGNALTINDVEATNATDYTWYKSADNSFDVAADTKVGTSEDLLLAASSITEEANQTFYLFCVASNSCGSVTSNAITVTVTPFVEEECATKGNEGEHEFGFTNTSCSEATLDAKKVWSTNSNSKYLTYTAPEGRYFAKAKVQVAHSSKTIAAYAYTTDGTNWTAVELTGLTTSLTTKEITFPENVTGFRIGRRFDDKGVGSGNFYLYEACFTYENACTPTSVTPTTASFEYNMSVQMDFVEPTFTVKHGEEVVNDAVLTYTSSNPAIATVDEEGSVTFEGMTGTVTITAAYAGTTIDEIEYCASEGSYTITVGCQDQEPKIIAAAGTNLDGCNNSITLEAKMQDGTTAFTGGTYQWYRDGEAIEGATSASYEVVRAGTYTVSRTDACTRMSSNSAVVTNENPEPKVERLTPFQYYHVDKDYSDQMKDRHLFAVTSYGTSDGKRYHLTATRNGETLDLSSSTAFFTIPSSDNAVDTVMIDLNELKGKYSANDEIVITCAPINNCNQVSAITSSITIHVIDQTPTLALICSGSNKASGTRKTSELTVGGDFLTGYNVADLCQQTGNTSFDANTEWGFYTELKTKYIVTPVNGYAEFNKLNYEPFDILLLTDYPKASKSEAAATILDDMAALCDYRPLLSLKAHMVAKSPSKWAAKGFTTSPVVPAATSQYANIVCYAHPMFDELDDTQVEGIYHDNDDFNQLVYQILTGPGHESGKGLQGFELKDADNFVTIGLIHYNAAAEMVTHTDGDDTHTHLKWTPAANDRQLVAIAERQANIEARMILFAINCGAQSMQTPMGRQVLLTCLDYLLKTDLIEVADCRLTFDNGEGNTNWGKYAYEGTGTKGDGLWSTAANWGPDYLVVPGRNNDVRIAAPCTVDANNVEVLSVHITEDGSLTIPADKSLTARSTILRADEHGNVYPTNVADISLGSNADGNASLILNNERGDTKAGVAMYSTADADTEGYSAAESTWQYIGTPHSDVQNAANNYYDSWLYQYDTETQGWAVIPNGGPLVPFRGYCVTHPESPHTYWMEGTLVSTTNQDISIPANRFVVVANSWTAPIQINELTDDDMEGLTDKTIYFFNTGSDPNQEGELDKENGRYAAGTYVSVPIHSAPYTGDSYIPSMQGFYVVGGGADGTLHLDYERHVRAKRENVPSGPMHAPARITDTDNEPQVAKFLFRGTRYDDRLIILERPDFTRGYDSGWDGEQWGGNAAAPMSYVVTETRWDAVSAIPEYEGTVIAFRAGEDSEYTIHFDYDGMEDALYLLDTDTQIYTRVLKGNSYTFTCADKAEHNRFILTRKAPQIATGTENINTGENAKAVKFIKDDKIFIFVNGMLYDATGKMVIR